MFPFIPVVIAVGVGVLVGKLFGSDDKSDKSESTGSKSTDYSFLFGRAKNLVVLGPQSSGKTELWYALQGKTRNSVITTSNESIPNFTIKSEDGTKRYIKEGKDIGGTDDYSYKYDELLKKDSIVYFLLDINEIGSDKYKAQPLSQLKKILEFFPSVKEKSVKILATHIDEYRGDRLLGEKVVRDYLSPLEGYGYDRTKFNVKLVNLKDPAVIRMIKREILES